MVPAEGGPNIFKRKSSWLRSKILAGRGGGVDLDLGANLKAHKPPGKEHIGVPDDSAYRPARGGV